MSRFLKSPLPAISPFLTQHFAFAIGRVGVLQQLLLSESDRDRLLGAPDISAVEQILTELKITNAIDQGISVADDILMALGAWIKEEIESMTPVSHRPVFSILWLREDEALLSYLLKKHHNLTSSVSALPSTGMSAYPPKALAALVQEGEKGTLPEHLTEFVASIKALKEPTPMVIDRLTARYIATVRTRLARTSGSNGIRRFVAHTIDAANIKTAVRLPEEDESKEEYLHGGFLPTEVLTGSRKTIASAIAKTEYYPLKDAIEHSFDDPVELERSLSRITADDIAHMWNVPLSIDPVFAFAAIAQLQLQLIRAIVIGKRANLSPQEIKKIIPPFLSASHYVTS